MRLTQTMKDDIIRRMSHQLFAEREAEIKTDEHALALRVRDSLLGDLKDSFLKLPDYVCEHDHYLAVNVGGRVHHLAYGQSTPSFYGRPTLPARLGDEVTRFVDRKEALDREKKELQSTARSVLASVNTAKQLKDAWPEGEKFYAEVLADAAPSKSLVPFNKLNERIAEVAR